MNIALILAGGTGTRLGGSLPKQYIEVKGKPVISYSLAAFERHREIDEIWIVAAEPWRSLIREWTGEKFRGFSRPGENRQLSIYNGLTDISAYANEGDIVVVHDGARPLVKEGLISACLTACASHEGVVPVLPMKDTVYLGEGGRITALLEREKIYAGQAPEAFVLGRYLDANKRLLPDRIRKINGSTEPAMLAGMDVALVPGDENNFKITTMEDLQRFRRVMDE